MPASRRALKCFAPPSASPLAPAAKAYRATMRARGQDAAAAGGGEALTYLLTRIREADPAKADVREAILDTAWAGLPEWRS